MTTTKRRKLELGRIGESLPRPDGTSKVRGEFEYSSDLSAPGMLHGATLRSPHAAARIIAIDITAAVATAGVSAVLTHQDVPGRATYGMETLDQPVLAGDVVRYEGEPIAIIAADHPETARLAASRITIEWELLAPVTGVEAALAPTARPVHPSGNCLRQVRIQHGAADVTAEVVVRGTYEVGMQDQAFLGPESGMAVPAADGGVDLYIATQWLHSDRDQIAPCLGLEPERVRLHMSGVGGAFGGREDLSMQVHACMLALHTGLPVRMVYSRAESFYGHVHRHPARMHYEHGATRDGKLVYVKARVELDGGAYASSSTAVVANAACFACGPYEVPNATIDAVVAYTNNPPCGAMRGFGAVQVAFAHEAQMDLLAAAVGVTSLQIRMMNALHTGSILPTGQRVDGPAPVAELLRALEAMPMPTNILDGPGDRPGGYANTTHGEGVARGVGYAVAFKNLAYAEGFDDYSTARVVITQVDGEPQVHVYTAAAEVGQGLIMVQEQIARTELGIERVRIHGADTMVGSSGSSSASRQTVMTGGAVLAACRVARDELLRRAAVGLVVLPDEIALSEERAQSGGRSMSFAELVAVEPIDVTREYHHRPTVRLDPETGQGDAHVGFVFAAHRAVCDVDCDLGLVRTVEIATTQEVGKALNPMALEGQIHGGIAQGLGLALMEEIQVVDGLIRNASFTDYLMPTTLDMPPIRLQIFETPYAEGPYGATGVGEPPAIAATPAVVAALRAATGQPLTRVPVRPTELAGL